MPEKDRQLMVERREKTRSNYGISSKTSHHKGGIMPGQGGGPQALGRGDVTVGS